MGRLLKETIMNLITKTITIKDYTGQEVTRRVIGIDPFPCLSSISNQRLHGEHFVLEGPPEDPFKVTYAPTSNPYKVQ